MHICLAQQKRKGKCDSIPVWPLPVKPPPDSQHQVFYSMCSEALCKLVSINIEFYILFSVWDSWLLLFTKIPVSLYKTNSWSFLPWNYLFFFFLRYMHFYFVYSFGWQCSEGTSTPRIEPTAPVMEAQSLYHWTTREVPWNYFWWAFRFTLFTLKWATAGKLTLTVLKYGHCFSYSYLAIFDKQIKITWPCF